MNRLALTICVLGVAVAGYTPVTLSANQDQRAPEAGAVASLTHTTTVSKLANPKAVSVAVWTPPLPSFSAPLEQPTLPEAVYSEALPSAYNGDYDMPVWAVVTRGARLHSGPSVSSSTLWFYPVGAQLHLVGYRQGWFKVVDPQTLRQGYIYAAHYLDALRGPTATPTVVANAPQPAPTELAEPAQAAPVKLAARPVSQATPSLLAPADIPAAEAPAPATPAPIAARRSESVASLLDRAIRR
jgi:hypothetical protein